MAIDRRPGAPERGIRLSGRLDAPLAVRTVALLLLPIVLVAHTHPYFRPARGPSNADRAALRKLGQTRSYLIEAGRIIGYRR